MASCLAIVITGFGAHMVYYAGKGFARLALTIVWLAPWWFFSGYMEDEK